MKKQKNYFTRVSAQVLLLAMSLSLLDSCTQGFRTEQETPAVSGITLLLPKENQEFGELLSKTLRETTIAVKEKHIALSDQKAVYAAAAQAAQSVLKEEGKEPVLLTTGETYEMVAEGAASDKALTAKPELTATQKAYLDRIEVAIMQSPTYARFAEALVKINNEIAEAVPAEERALLLNVTATLHYGLKTMNELVGEGLLPGQAEKSGVQDIQVGALSQAGFFPLLLVAGGGREGEPCRRRM